MNFSWGFFMVIHPQNLSIRAYTKGFCSYKTSSKCCIQVPKICSFVHVHCFSA
jgi:hypothetical protein